MYQTDDLREAIARLEHAARNLRRAVDKPESWEPDVVVPATRRLIGDALEHLVEDR